MVNVNVTLDILEVNVLFNSIFLLIIMIGIILVFLYVYYKKKKKVKKDQYKKSNIYNNIHNKV